MRQKLLLLVAAASALGAGAQTAQMRGLVENGTTGSPISGATVSINNQGISSTTGFNGDFTLSGLKDGPAYVTITCDGYLTAGYDIQIVDGKFDLGTVRLTPLDYTETYYADTEDMLFDEAVLEDEESASQGVTALTGASDDLFYNTASYNFSPMYFRFRGYDSQYQSVYINGIRMNDPIRGRFNFSGILMGMTSRAFRNRTNTIGLAAANYGFGSLGGSTNYNTVTDLYAPGFNGSAAYTNSNYMLRGMVTYSTPVNRKGWAFTVSAIARYAKEGVIEGTFYNSGALFFSAEKILNENNRLVLTAFGGPTQRATSSATYQEAYDLTGSNLYNPDWGWQDGKKRASKITETYDPTAILNWIYQKGNTTVNTAVAVHYGYYSRSALQYYKANDPNPAYYRNLPSYYSSNEELYDLYTWKWEHDPSVRQINWEELYRINYLNNIQNSTAGPDQQKGSSYIMENRINTQWNYMANSYVNTRLNDVMSLQGGVSLNYTRSDNYKKVRDLLGGEFWLDVDPFSDRDITIAPENLQNDLDNPNRHVVKGDKFGYNYTYHYLNLQAWLQNVITLPKFDINYGLQASYTQFQREGHMRNGRAPQESLGKGELLQFDNVSVKAGATYKINGRNYILAHAEFGTRAPLADQVYLAPRVKNTTIADPTSERILAFDLGYTWTYRGFRGSITGFHTTINNAIERTGFYDEQYNTYANYVLSGVKRRYMGIEAAFAVKITPSLTWTAAGSFGRFQYKNNPMGTRTFENGLYPDVTNRVYLKNYFMGCTPNTNMNIGFDYAAPKNWYFNVNGTWQGNSYVNLSPAYHEALPGLWEQCNSEAELMDKIAEFSVQDKLKDAFTLNASIGKAIYLNRKVSLNFNLSVYNITNNRGIVTYAYQQGRIDTKNYNRNAYPNKYTYAQGIRLFFNAGVRF